MSGRTRTWVISLMAMVAGLAGGFLAFWWVSGDPVVAEEMVAQTSGVVSAPEFRLVDQRGKVRAVLGFSAQEEPYLSLRDRDETSIVWLGLSEESGLVIHDADGKTRLLLSLDTAGIPSLVMRNRQHQTRSITP